MADDEKKPKHGAVDPDVLLGEITNPEFSDPKNEDIVKAIKTQLWGLPSGWKYAGPAHFVLVYGRTFEWAPLPKGFKIGGGKACFKNSFTATKKKGLVYLEGFVLLPKLRAVHHAWNLNEDGRVVDLTLTPEDAERSRYFGVAFTTEFVLATKGSKGRDTHSLLDDFEKDFPLLKSDELLPEALDPRFR